MGSTERLCSLQYASHPSSPPEDFIYLTSLRYCACKNNDSRGSNADGTRVLYLVCLGNAEMVSGYRLPCTGGGWGSWVVTHRPRLPWEQAFGFWQASPHEQAGAASIESSLLWSYFKVYTLVNVIYWSQVWCVARQATGARFAHTVIWKIQI